jgi:hypothetical protein
MSALLLLSLLGCTSPFEGTWLFMVDRQERLSGDCADPDDTTVYTGDDRAWVDIFQLQSGEFSVLLSEVLIGTAAGNDLEASWQETYSSEDYEERTTVDLEATLAAGELSGSIASSYSQATGDDTYECQGTVNFTAVRNVSSPTSYPEN